MAARKRILNGLFKELFISTNNATGYTNIGIYDQGYESFTVDELVEIRAHLNNVILNLKFPDGTEGLPF